MPSDRTFVTELATGLGMLGHEGGPEASRKPRQMVNLDENSWSRLQDLSRDGTYESDFAAGLANGRAFLRSPDALNGRRPRIVEWTGGRRPPGDEVVPSDLRIDHVYLISCKYLSKILHNPSPARLVDHLLVQTSITDAPDWYARVAPAHFQQLYETCVQSAGVDGLPQKVSELTRLQRRQLAAALHGSWPPGAEAIYLELCSVVSEVTAHFWRERLKEHSAEAMLWRLLRIGSAPYFILGTSSAGSMRLRIDSPWDWRQSFRLRRFEVEPQIAGQPRVRWTGAYEHRATHRELQVSGHVEIRWSHGRFAQPPEAKVYLDSPHEEVPGYHALEEKGARRPSASTRSAELSGPFQGELWSR